jgi:hypothetical protein
LKRHKGLQPFALPAYLSHLPKKIKHLKGGDPPMQSTVEETDLFKSAYLLASGGDLDGIRIKPGHRRIAAFTITGYELEKLEMDYRRGQALVNPLQLRECLNHLRDMLFDKLRQSQGRMRNDRRASNTWRQHRR